jgi:gamma-D-glutamyl-L-lysine dipeptidyl-peptidase
MRYGMKDSRLIRYNVLFLLMFLTAAVSVLSGCSGASGAVSGIDGPGSVQGSSQEESIEYVFGIPMDKNAAVITDNVADIYVKPDVKSTRVTQALYNQPVSILQKEQGWAKVSAVDGSTGWIKLKYLDSDISSIYGRTYTDRIIVTSREKEIASNPSGGVTQMNAPMGSEFFAFNSSGDAYEVFLPGNKTGWFRGSSGTIHVELNEMIPVTNADDFAATAQRLKGASYLLNGLSNMGIDAPGLVYVCAHINGIDLPRSLAGQLASGTEIKPEDAQTGDLLFLAGAGEGEGGKVISVGICTGGGNYLYAGRKIGYVAVGDINKDNSEGTIIAARRVFN